MPDTYSRRPAIKSAPPSRPPPTAWQPHWKGSISCPSSASPHALRSLRGLAVSAGRNYQYQYPGAALANTLTG
jgi:hypothetical protein